MKKGNAMDKTTSKFITLSFAAAGALVGVTFHLLLLAFAGAFGIVARFADSDLVRHVLPVVLGILVFGLLQFNSRVVVWADEVIGEIRKVVWPSRKDTWAMAMVVVVMVMISSVIISVFDISSGFAINLLR